MPQRIVKTLEALGPGLKDGVDHAALEAMLPPGGARNAIDCALWELRSHRDRVPVWRLAGLDAPPRPLLTTYTVGLGTPRAMAALAADHVASGARAIKIKLDGSANDLERVAAVRAASPDAWLAVDPNQGWTLAQLHHFAPRLVDMGIALIEQPLPVGKDAALEGWRSPIPLAADESAGTAADLPALAGKYQVINIKLDKAGGLTQALACARRARALGFGVMVGNMGGTSLAMAPAFIVGQLCDVVDLDGPLNLTADREPATVFRDGLVDIAPGTWGHD